MTREERLTILGLINEMTKEDALEVHEWLRARIKMINNKKALVAKVQFQVGDEVVFGRRNGQQRQGKIVKMLRKNIRVRDTNGGLWNVHPALVEAA